MTDPAPEVITFFLAGIFFLLAILDVWTAVLVCAGFLIGLGYYVAGLV